MSTLYVPKKARLHARPEEEKGNEDHHRRDEYSHEAEIHGTVRGAKRKAERSATASTTMRRATQNNLRRRHRLRRWNRSSDRVSEVDREQKMRPLALWQPYFLPARSELRLSHLIAPWSLEKEAMGQCGPVLSPDIEKDRGCLSKINRDLNAVPASALQFSIRSLRGGHRGVF